MRIKKLAVMEESDRSLFEHFFSKEIIVSMCANGKPIDSMKVSMYEIYSKANFWMFNILENNNFNSISTTFYRHIINDDDDHVKITEKYTNEALKDYVVKNYFKKDIASNYITKNISSVPEIEELL